MEVIPIRGDMIRLGQLLKLAGVVGAGSDVKLLLAHEVVIVNGELETRRGRQLGDGDIIELPGLRQTLQVSASQAD